MGLKAKPTKSTSAASSKKKPAQAPATPLRTPSARKATASSRASSSKVISLAKEREARRAANGDPRVKNGANQGGLVLGAAIDEGWNEAIEATGGAAAAPAYDSERDEPGSGYVADAGLPEPDAGTDDDDDEDEDDEAYDEESDDGDD